MRNILVIEDNAEYAEAFKTFFGAKGLDVTHAEDFERGKAALHEQEYDGIVTDLFFPQAKGSEKRDYVEPVISSAAVRYQDILRNYGGADEANQALGFYFLKHGMEHGIPSVLVTDGYHHDDNLEGFAQSGMFSDSGPYFAEIGAKRICPITGKDTFLRDLQYLSRIKEKKDCDDFFEGAFLEILIKKDMTLTKKASYSVQQNIYGKLKEQTASDFDGGYEKNRFLVAAAGLDDILHSNGGTE